MFLLVLAHPGCPGQIPQSRKRVVCVCVCVCMCAVYKNLTKVRICGSYASPPGPQTLNSGFLLSHYAKNKQTYVVVAHCL